MQEGIGLVRFNVPLDT